MGRKKFAVTVKHQITSSLVIEESALTICVLGGFGTAGMGAVCLRFATLG